MSGTVPQIEVGRTEGLVDVHLLGLPLAIHQAAEEHRDELRREFALLRLQDADLSAADVPVRLLDLMDSLEARFSRFAESTRLEIEEAVERGEETVDVVFRVPSGVKSGITQLGQLLDEADDYCRRGGSLLTLQAPPEALAYRRWYLDQFIRQIDGDPAIPWPGA
ncbi:MAG: hypothetical protein WD232_09685 [Acidimicrobiales bacterium]